jgi:acetyl-CoA hydrolase
MRNLSVLPRVPDLAQWIRPGDRVVCGQVGAEPLTLTRALVAQRHALRGVEVFVGSMFSDTFAPEHADVFTFRSYGAMAKAAPLAGTGVLQIVPAHYSELEPAFEQGALQADVVLLQLAPPRAGGGTASAATRYSFGSAHDYVVAAARRARVVIAEIHPSAPWSHGAEVPDDFRIDLAVAADAGPVDIPTAKAGEIEQAIAALIAERIPDGAVLQTGIGSLPDAVLAGLTGHRDLGVHSGMIGDGVVDLIEAGVITNARKNIDPGVSITNLVAGTQRARRHVDGNPAFRVVRGIYSHGAAQIASLERFHSINSALEVDLSGQVNAETLGGKARGGVGGMNDFVRGARRSPGGRSILALPATAAGGRLSRIVPQLSGPATVTRSDVDLVVTEHGVADLRHCDLSQRAQRLIAIAAPQFREALERALREPTSWSAEGRSA